MQKVDALRRVAAQTTPEDLFVTSVGGIIDDWWNTKPGHEDNTISLSALGSVCTVSLGLALALPHRRIVALDTDGSILMNMGALATVAAANPSNLTVVVSDNRMYECIGSVPTLTAGAVDIAAVGRAVGFDYSEAVDSEGELDAALRKALTDDALGMIVARLDPGMAIWPVDERRDTDGTEDKYRFIRYVERLEGITVHNAVPPHV